MLPKERDASLQIFQCMETIKKLSEETQNIKNGATYQNGIKYAKVRSDVVGTIKRKIKSYFFSRDKDFSKIVERYQKDLPTAVNDRSDCNYFSQDRIAVYTCIIGKYDALQEPLIQPDNIDYYAITDFDVPSSSKWQRINADDFHEIDGFTPALKNRYFKINPHLVFPEYKYSIYVDGNFKIYSDFTEHVNRMSKYGFSHFRHSKRTCAYKEAEVCIALGKEKIENISNYIERLKSEGFPENYGLLACDILVREHNKRECISIMEQWWYEFRNYVKRDQLSLPYVLFKNGISVDDVVTLGGDVHKDYSFEIVKHIK